MTGAVDSAGLAKVIRDLLVIAKVAMPPKLYLEDPRIAIASTILKQLEEGISPSWAPNVTSRPPGLDVAALGLARPVEQSKDGISFIANLPWCGSPPTSGVFGRYLEKRVRLNRRRPVLV